MAGTFFDTSSTMGFDEKLHINHQMTYQDAILAGYKELNPREIIECHQLYHSSPIIHTASTAVINSLLASGISFKRKNHELTEEARMFYGNIWNGFVRSMVIDMHKYGFAVATAVPYPEYKKIPSLVNLHAVKVLLKCTYDGLRDYKIFRTDVPMANEKSLEDVFVFEMDPPGPDGCLRSKVSILRREEEKYRFYEEVNCFSHLTNSFVQHMAQFTPNKFNSEDLHMGIELNQAGSRSDEIVQVPMSLNQIIDNARASSINQFSFQTGGLSSGGVGINSHNNQLIGFRFDRYNPNNGQSLSLIPVGFEYVNANRSIPPSDTFVSNNRVEYEEKIGAVFQVPRSMFCDSATTKDSIEQKGGMKVFFIQAQKSLRQLLIPKIRELFLFIYLNDFAKEHIMHKAGEKFKPGYGYKHDAKKKSKKEKKEKKKTTTTTTKENNNKKRKKPTSDAEEEEEEEKKETTEQEEDETEEEEEEEENIEISAEDKDEMGVEVELNAQPPTEEAIEYFQLGILKFEAVKEIIASTYYLPLDFFEEKAPVRPHELQQQDQNIKKAGVKVQEQGVKVQEKGIDVQAKTQREAMKYKSESGSNSSANKNKK